MEPEYSESPGKNVFTLQLRKDAPRITIRSNFDSGNIGRVELGLNASVVLYPANDCTGSPYESHAKGWFYFGVSGVAVGSRVKFIVKKMNQLGSQVLLGSLRERFLTISDRFSNTLMETGIV